MAVRHAWLFWLLALGLFLVLLAAHETRLPGRAGGRPASATRPGSAHAQTWETEVLGLLALLVGFSFGMAVDRFDARRQLIVDEANAIGTTYLRTRFLPEPAGAAAARPAARVRRRPPGVLRRRRGPGPG